MTDTDMTEDELREAVSKFLRRNFPQIQMHGGESSILEADPEEGRVQIALGGACSGCGISPMTTQAIKRRMTNEIDAVEQVTVDTGMGQGGFGTGAEGMLGGSTSSRGGPSEDDDETEVDAPF